MLSPNARTVIASLCLTTSLGACVSSGTAPVDPGLGAAVAYRVTLPPPPEGVEACLRQAFPDIPDRALTRADVVRIVGNAIVRDRAKTRCGLRAVAWITAVRRDFAR